MRDLEKNKSIFYLYQEGMKITELAQRFNLDRKTIKRIILAKGNILRKKRSDRIEINESEILKTLKDCNGYGERAYEILSNKGLKMSYSTFMKKVRGVKNNNYKLSTPVEDIPGEEFQHDTSPYMIKIDNNKVRVVSSLLYYRYSKARYLKFYFHFCRFDMKKFFHEAIMHYGYVPTSCIVDNTNLVVKCGSGEHAVFHQEMADFAKGFGFSWKAHAIKHCDRKAGVEKGHHYVETNFFPGRTFSSLEDLNKQALEWCRDKFIKPNKNKIIPEERFNREKLVMFRVSPYLPAPYVQKVRIVDQEGYVLHKTNLYWVGIKPRSEIALLEYADKIVIYHQRKKVYQYDLPPVGTTKKKFRPEGVTIPYRPKKRTVPPVDEEKELRGSQEVDGYLNMAMELLGPQEKYKLIRHLYYLFKKLPCDIFIRTIVRAHKYRVKNPKILENMAVYLMNRDNFILNEYLEGPPDANSPLAEGYWIMGSEDKNE